jgi:hypothetical protein
MLKFLAFSSKTQIDLSMVKGISNDNYSQSQKLEYKQALRELLNAHSFIPTMIY